MESRLRSVSGWVAVALLFSVITLAASATVPLPTSVPDVTCNNNGYVAAGRCICFSGFDGAACDVAHELSVAESCGAAIIAHSKQQNYYLKIDEDFLSHDHFSASSTAMKFYNNHLALGFRGEFVHNRQYRTIGWKNNADNDCHLSASTNGTYWTQAVNMCQDTFVLDMPWSSHGKCGFALKQNADETYHVYSNTLIVEYVDEIPTIVGTLPPLARSTRMFVNVFLKFPKIINVEITGVNVSSPYINFPGITKFFMGENDGLLHMQLTTATIWPHTITTENLALDLPTQLAWAGGIQDIGLDWSACNNDTDSLCVQRWNVVIVPHDCVFDGEYVFHFTITNCRNQLELCQKTVAQISFHVVDSNNCQTVTVTPTVSGALHFTESDFSTPAPYVNVGTTGYFATTIESAGGNTVTMEYEQIWYKHPEQATRVYLLRWDTAASPRPVAVKQTEAVVGGETLTLVPANLQWDDVHQNFTMFFHGSLFRLNPGESKMFTFGAQVKVKFAGNLDEEKANYPVVKRMEFEQDFTFESAQKDQVSKFSVQAGIRNPAVALSQKTGAASPTASNLIVSIVVPLAAVAAITVIAVVVYVAKTKKEFAKLSEDPVANVL